MSVPIVQMEYGGQALVNSAHKLNYKVSNTMNLRDQGFRFCISPDKQRGRWCHPVEIPHFYANWTDHTDTPEKEFIEFLQNSVDVGGEQP